MKVKRLFGLIFINVRASYFRLFECFKVVWKYYFDFQFLLMDLYLLCLYFFKNPYKISRDFLKKKGERCIYQYGETPLSVMDKICMECGILERDILYDLGCGRGRTSLWMHKFIGCKVIAFDYLPHFIHKANRVKSVFSLEGIEFEDKDIFKIDYSNASAVYLYGTCFSNSSIKKICRQFESLPRNAKVITISYPLTSYSSIFSLEKEFTIHLPWGRTVAYFQRRI